MDAAAWITFRCTIALTLLTLPGLLSARPPVAPSPRPLTLDTCVESRGYASYSLRTSDPSGWRFVEGRFGEEPVQFLIDTAVVDTCLDPRESARLCLGEAKPLRREDKPSGRKYWHADLRFGHLHLRGQRIESAECKEYFEKGQPRVRGVGAIIGLDVLSERGAVLDCRFNRVHLLSQRGLQSAGDRNPADGTSERVLQAEGAIATELYVGKWTGRWYLRAALEGKGLVFLLDSGASINLLFPRAAETIGHTPKRGEEKLPGLDGKQFQLYQHVAPRLSVKGAKGSATVAFAICDPIITEEEWRKDGLPQCDGILGNPFLNLFGAVFDFRNKCLFLQSHNFGLVDPALEGEWSVTSFDAGDGLQVTPEVRQGVIRIKGDKLLQSNGDDWKEFRISTAPWKEEKWIEWIWVDPIASLPGIYQIGKDGKTLRLAVSLKPEYSERVRPTKFSADKSKAHVVIELEKKP